MSQKETCARRLEATPSSRWPACAVIWLAVTESAPPVVTEADVSTHLPTAPESQCRQFQVVGGESIRLKRSNLRAIRPGRADTPCRDSGGGITGQARPRHWRSRSKSDRAHHGAAPVGRGANPGLSPDLRARTEAARGRYPCRTVRGATRGVARLRWGTLLPRFSALWGSVPVPVRVP